MADMGIIRWIGAFAKQISDSGNHWSWSRQVCWRGIFTKGSHPASINGIWNTEAYCYGCQCSKSNWTQPANVIYWCSVGPRSPKPGEHTGPKTHKWDIDRSEWGERKSKVIFNHEVPHLVYREVNVLSLPSFISCSHQRARTLYSTVLWRSAVYVLMTLHQIGHWEQSWQHPRCSNEKNDTNFKRFYSECAPCCAALYSDSIKERAPLLQLCVFIFLFSPRGQL